MASLLSDRQRTELNRTILAYLAQNKVPVETLSGIDQVLRDQNPSTTNGDASAPSILQSSDEDIRKQALVLEKKWTSVVRLQRKVLDLESQVSLLKEELENAPAGPSRVGRAGGPDAIRAWLPRAPCKYSLTGHRQPVTSIAFHPVFSAIASSSEDGTVKIWDWEMGELERTIKAHTKAVLDVDFGGPSGQEILLASCSSDLTIRLWDPANDYANIRTLTGHDHTISTVRFTPDGAHLISASRDKTIRIWAVKTGYAVRTIRGHSEWVRCAVPSADGLYILSGGSDQAARVSTFGSGDGKLLFVGHDHVIESVAFAPPSSYRYLSAIEGLKQPVASTFSASFEYVATASRDKTIKIWNTRQEPIATLTGHDNWVRALAFHPAGKYLLSVSDDRTIRCWDLSQQGRCVKVIQDAHQHFVSCLRWAPASSSSADSSHPLSPTDPKHTTNHHQLSSKEDGGALKDIRLLLATGSVDLQVKIWM